MLRPSAHLLRTIPAIAIALAAFGAPAYGGGGGGGGGTAAGGTSSKAHRTRHRKARVTVTRFYSPTSAAALETDLSSLIAGARRGGHWGVLVVSLTRGDTLFALDADSALQPASNMKLFTTALALDQFGPSHQFRTEVLRTGEVTGGTLHGDLVIRGDGDPALSARFVDGGPDAPMARLAQVVADAGIKRVSGALIADASAFDPQRIPEGWKRRYLGATYAARISALSLNENLLDVVVRPAKDAGPHAVVALEPNTDFPVKSSVRTVSGRGSRLSAWATKSGTIEVHGWIGTRTGERHLELVVEDPTAFAAGAFRRALQARGITVDGATAYGPAPVGAVKVGDLPSPELATILSAMNRESINHFAELVFRDAARHGSADSIGSAESGNALLQKFLVGKVGVDSNAVIAADGSGLSVLDRVTPRALVQLLAYSNRASWSQAFHESLPVAGESELLAKRMRATPAQGNLHAKTGTTNTVISLGGYVTSQNGELLAFAMIYNGWDRGTAKYTIDEIGATLANFVRQ